MKAIWCLPLLAVVILCGGCWMPVKNVPMGGQLVNVAPFAPVTPPLGRFVSVYRAPLSVGPCEIPPRRLTVGKSKTQRFHDIFITGLDYAWGDASLEEAIEDGELTRVYYADYETLVILFGLYGQFTVYAYGE